MEQNEQLTKKEWELIGHSLGVNIYMDKDFPNSYYRNFFGTGKNTDNYKVFEKLVKKGYAIERTQFGEPVFHISEKGIEMFEKNVNQK